LATTCTRYSPWLSRSGFVRRKLSACAGGLDLEREHPTLTVNHTVQRARTGPGNEKRRRSQIIFENAPKTQAGTGRVIVIPSPLLAPLNAQRTDVLAQQQARASWRDYDLLFPATRGTPLEEHSVVSQSNSVGASGSANSGSAIRPAPQAASLSYAQGVPPLQIAEILGHTDPDFTVRTYTHLAGTP